jgi:LEA14-like dessication related protein
MNNKSFHLLLLLIVIISGCKGVEDITMTGVSDFKFKGIDNDLISFSAVVGVSNPSRIGFHISEVNVKTMADGTYLGTLSTTDKIRIPARSDTSYRMNFTLKLANVLTSAASLYSLSHKKEVLVELQGYVKSRSFLATHKTNIKESRKVAVPSMN